MRLSLLLGWTGLAASATPQRLRRSLFTVDRQQPHEQESSSSAEETLEWLTRLLQIEVAASSMSVQATTTTANVVADRTETESTTAGFSVGGTLVALPAPDRIGGSFSVLPGASNYGNPFEGLTTGSGIPSVESSSQVTSGAVGNGSVESTPASGDVSSVSPNSTAFGGTPFVLSTDELTSSVSATPTLLPNGGSPSFVEPDADSLTGAVAPDDSTGTSSEVPTTDTTTVDLDTSTEAVSPDTTTSSTLTTPTLDPDVFSENNLGGLIPTQAPTHAPSDAPSDVPSVLPTTVYEEEPTATPSDVPSTLPTLPPDEDRTETSGGFAISLLDRDAQIRSKCNVEPTFRAVWIRSLLPPHAPDVVDWILNQDPALLCPTDSLVQRYALASLYFHLSGPNWTSSAQWMTEAHECDWQGVHCNQFQQVEYIRLSNNGLEGDLPQDILELKTLKGLSLDDNAIGGTLPTEGWEHMLVLEYWDMDHNLLEGTLPDGLFGVSTLQALDLDHNQLVGPVPELSALTDLIVLQLDHNGLTGLVPDLTANEQLVQVRLAGNALDATSTALEDVCAVVPERRTTNASYLQFLSADCALVCSCCSSCAP